jgi:hypothetical protein
MTLAPPTPSEMFSDVAGNPTAIAERFEAFKGAMRDSETQAQGGGQAFAPQHGIVRKTNQQAIAERVANLEKGLSPDAAASFAADLDAIKGSLGELNKDWSVTFPNSAGLVPYDLEAPAKLLVPRQTPLRNSIPRVKGQGTGRQFKRITGWTNSGVGGVADAMAFMNSESVSTAFGPISLRRGNKITYTSDSKTVAYQEQGLSDLVTWKAQFAGQGFESIRQLSQTALLWASFGAEERALLFGRGTSGNGFAGVVSAPVISGATSTTGGTIAAGTYQITVTARAGGGETVVSNRVAQVTTGATSTITVTVGTEPTGALGYNLYVSQAGGGAASETFQFSFSGNVATLSAPPVAGGQAIPGADSTANASAYDGYLTVQADPTQSGYVKRINLTGANAILGANTFGVNSRIGTGVPVGDQPWQDAFLAMYGGGNNPGGGATYGNKLLADPDEIWVDGSIRNALGQWLKTTASTTAYRIALTDAGVDGNPGATVGAVIGAISNQTTGKMVNLAVHPYMPVGCSLIRSKNLPVPDSEVSSTSAVVNVQDYMSVEWPVIQFTYDVSTYWFGALVHYAPAWSGLILGLNP